MSKHDEPEDLLLTFRGEDWSVGAWLALIRDRYLTLDRRTLGATRILLGFLLLTDVIHRHAAWNEMFSTIGVLPNHVGLGRPQATPAFSIFNAFSTPAELAVLFAIMIAVSLALLVGYRMRLAQILALVLVTGMNGRVLLAENGGYIVENLLLLWTAFLPMGDRFSIDALVASMKRRREATAEELNDREGERDEPAYVSLAGLAVLLQLAAIYFFNVVHKTGNAWRNGTAVHYVMHVDRMATPIVAVVRDHVPALGILVMTKAALTFEAALPVALLAPVARAWSRRAAIFLINALHLAFGVTFVLGPFAWSCCVFSTLLFGREDWELATRTMRRPHRARVVLFDPRSGGALFVCRLLKRLDRLALLTFAPKGGLALGVAVRRADASIAHRADALADVLAALPLGPIVAWIPRLPVARGLVDAALRALEPFDLSRFFGLHTDAPSAPPSKPPLASLRRVVSLRAREGMVAIMIAAAINEGAVELWAINRRVTVPHVEPLRTLALKLRFLQGWFMFSPNPVMEDGTIVVDAITADGRHVDPFTARAPDFDLSHAKSLRLTQQWCDYFNRIQLPSNVGYREAMRDYLVRLPERTGRPEDAIVSGEVYWVKDLSPRWNEHEPWGYERVLLFSFVGGHAR
jgi:hypothetical protein